MTKPLAIERIDKRAAAAILGCTPRAIVAMAARGELAAAGAAKLCREWTFDEKRLRAYVRIMEEAACQDARERRRDAIGAVIPSGAARMLKDVSIGGRLTQTMQKLRKRAAQQARQGFSP